MSVLDPLAQHDPAGELRERHADRLGHERDGTGGLVDWPRSRTARRWCPAYWTFSSPTTPILRAISRVAARICSSISSPSECGGSTHALSPECTPASSTCCVDPADPHLAAAIGGEGPVTESVHVDLGRVLEEAVQKDRTAPRRGLAAEVVLEDPRASRRSPSPVPRARRTGGRAAESLPPRPSAGPPRPSGRSQTVGPDSQDARGARRTVPDPQPGRSPPRSCRAGAHPPRPARLRASGASCPRTARSSPAASLDLDHGEHILQREQLEVEAVGGVVVGGRRLGIAIDHDRIAT